MLERSQGLYVAHHRILAFAPCEMGAIREFPSQDEIQKAGTFEFATREKWNNSIRDEGR